MRAYSRRRAAVLAAAALLGLATTAAAAPQPQRLSILTGGTGGVYYVYGGGLAQVLSRHLPGVEATAEVTAASIENLQLLARRSGDLAFTLADTLQDAVKGQGKFPAPLPIRSLAVLYGNMTHVVARTGGPASVRELKGKRVSLGAPNSGTELIAERVLRAHGLDPVRDVVRERLGVAESADALRDGRIDAFFWSGGLPTAAVLQLATSPGIRIALLPTDDIVPALVAQYGPLYTVATIPAGTYPGVDRDVKVAAVPNVLVAHRDMPDQLAFDILRTMFERKADLVAVHPAARELDLKTAAAGSPAEYHPGAVRFYREKGVWPGR
ncbi:MAG TPA: TAXI family TRAP transporter solute-binding subunit [Thermodesulfobacteriota bacterium]|nr:TAXI family TRAP transporter solute-binding subunit [Thermodesulfobacteriota bacterium]